MNLTGYFLLAVALCALGGGCATDNDDMKECMFVIRAAQTKTESSSHGALSASDATHLFQDVASRLGTLGRVNRLHHHQVDPTKPDSIEFNVSFTPRGATTVDLTMDMDGKHIIFRGEADAGDRESIAAMRKAMKLLQESLDARNIKYMAREFTTRLYFIPS